MHDVALQGGLAVTRARRRAHTRAVVSRVLAYIVTSTFALLFIAPFLWMVSMSLQDMAQLTTWPPQWIPSPFRWSNYPRAMTWPNRPFVTFFKNSVIYTTLATAGITISSSIAGYAFARLQARGRDALFVLVLSTMMLPSQVTLIPQYIIFRTLGWIDTLKPLIVPAFFGSAFDIFMFRQFFLTIPRELDEAAILDGCTFPGIFWRVILPLSKPVLVTVIAFSVVATWNNFFGPLIYLNSNERMTVAVGMRVFAQMGTGMGGVSELGIVMAAATTTVVPMVIVFLAAQRYFVTGITMTGLKV